MDDLVIEGAGNLKTAGWNVGENGFVILPGIFATDDISTVSEGLSALPVRRGGAGVRHLLKDPGVETLANDARLLSLAREILGPDAFPFRATLFNKSPDSNWLIPWHQDTALPVRERREAEGWGSWSIKDQVIYGHAPASALEQILALRVHLDDSTIENGPLRVLPGSHCVGVLSDDALTKLVERQGMVNCLVQQGGVLAMRPLLIHASSKSRTPLPRRVLHLEYASRPILSGGLQLAVA